VNTAPLRGPYFTISIISISFFSRSLAGTEMEPDSPDLTLCYAKDASGECAQACAAGNEKFGATAHSTLLSGAPFSSRATRLDRWTSYRANGLAQPDARLSPHPLYRALGNERFYAKIEQMRGIRQEARRRGRHVWTRCTIRFHNSSVAQPGPF
jgi:hypothetical protein